MFHVLLIKDDPRITRQMHDLVIEAGATSVDIATTAQGAVGAAVRRRPSVIPSDGVLADGIAPAACSRIRRKHGGVPIAFITASPALGRDRPYAFAVLSKPVPSGRLMGVLDSALIR